MSVLAPLSLFGPFLLLAVAVLAIARPGPRPGLLPRLAEIAAGGVFGLAAGNVVQLVVFGPSQLAFGTGAALMVFRLDAVGATMTLLVAFVGWVVVRYSRTYLDGAAREGAFFGHLLATLAAVLVLVQAGSLGVLLLSSAMVGLGMRQLL